ncbi:uncharacterized protein LOC118209382 [Anguilla anguilla]|uniref:uncharacterized protein LOC118209382 n=1 Tax=Anguilla anguilla TaxID=7936 RepID=UPI0015ADA932|nr:uncharacterized protein LOC118209382 [Anguilla anguilla]
MDCAVWTVIIFCVSAASRSRGCVLTDPANRVQEGSDVRLTCTFSTCPGPLDHTVHVTWEFNDTVVAFYYLNQTGRSHLEYVGDILAGDFSVLLRSVTPQHAGTYTCLVRPSGSGFIYKNRTLLAVAPRGSGRRIMVNSDPSVPLPLRLILGCCGAGLLVLAAGSMLGVGAYWRRGRGQWNTSRKNQGTPASTEEKCPHKDKDQDCYVTLQRGKAPPPASKEESIYVTMHGRPVPPGLQAQPSPNRKGIPTEWCAQENPPRVKNENLPSPHPDSSAASCHVIDQSGLS